MVNWKRTVGLGSIMYSILEYYLIFFITKQSFCNAVRLNVFNIKNIPPPESFHTPNETIASDIFTKLRSLIAHLFIKLLIKSPANYSPKAVSQTWTFRRVFPRKLWPYRICNYTANYRERIQLGSWKLLGRLVKRQFCVFFCAQAKSCAVQRPYGQKGNCKATVIRQ